MHTRDQEWSIEECDDGSDDLKKKRHKVYINLTALPGDTSLGMALFDHIFANFDPSALDEKDLSIRVYDKLNKKKMSANITDLIWYATNEKTKVPPKQVLYLFRKLRSAFSIPESFILNIHFPLPPLEELGES